MEPLNEAMKRAMPVNFKERYEQLKQTILEEPRVRSFLLANRAELTEQSIDRGIGKLQEFLEQEEELLADFQDELSMYSPFTKEHSKA